ncbi:MAG: anthranilate phosphoribosyltransferase [Planctomycetota bacterium]|nr:anthranilate phosphoribosyltransferase [Planctomycetota bacterium]
MSEMEYRDVLRTAMGDGLSRRQAEAAFGQIMSGAWTEAQIAGLLVAMATRGESVAEITGAATAMRAHSVKIDAGGRDVIDTCGTGGTGLSTLNVSTAAAIVSAGAGACVAKHGNRTHTRASGSADVLAALGVNIDADAETVTRCLNEAGVCFCFAVKHHPAMKYAVGVRKALGVRTIFNVLGPLTNPAGARRQVMGVFDADLVETIAEVLKALGAQRAMVVHADDGLDEISTTAMTHIAELKDGKITTQSVQPEDFGLTRATLADLAVESAAESAERIRQVLSGQGGPDRDIVLLNAAAALVVADQADTIAEGLTSAAEAIDSGQAAETLEKLIEISNSGV